MNQLKKMALNHNFQWSQENLVIYFLMKNKNYHLLVMNLMFKLKKFGSKELLLKS
jgi:hypothetical protein